MPKPPHARSESSAVSRLNIYDCGSIFAVVESLKPPASVASLSADGARSPNFDYQASKAILEKARGDLQFGPAQSALAVATIDPDSDGQQRFVKALGHLDILVECVDFRHATVTAPLWSDGERQEQKYLTTLGPSIAYVLGLMAGRNSPEVVIVTRVFEVYEPLLDFVTVRGGKAAVAFFRRFLDPRWAINGLFDTDGPVKFIDLDPSSEELLGVDVKQLDAIRTRRPKGISDI